MPIPRERRILTLHFVLLLSHQSNSTVDLADRTGVYYTCQLELKMTVESRKLRIFPSLPLAAKYFLQGLKMA